MNTGDRTATVVVIICLFLVIPIALIIAGVTSPSPFQAVKGEPLTGAAERSGMKVCRVTDLPTAAPGITLSRAYLVSRDCASTSSGNSATIYLMGFSSEGARDAVIRGYQSQLIGHTKPDVTLIPEDQYLMVIRGPHDRVLLENLIGAMKAKEAS
jgi:hypothetical protein